MSGYCRICGEPWDGHLTACAHLPFPNTVPCGTGGVADLERVYGPVVQIVPCPSCALLRAEVADLTRHAEAMANERTHDCWEDEAITCVSCLYRDKCPTFAYRLAHPLPPEKKP